MADNTILNLGAGGDTIATDDIGGGVKVQRVKLQFGLNGVATDVSATDPCPTKEEILDARYKTYEDITFVTGDSPVTVDVNTDLGRDGRSMLFTNDGPGNISVEVSNDGVTYSDVRTTQAGEEFSLGDLRIDSIRITWVADSAYRLLVI